MKTATPTTTRSTTSGRSAEKGTAAKRSPSSKGVSGTGSAGVRKQGSMDGLSLRLERIEGKLDALIEALAAEGEQEGDTIDVTTLDGVHDTRPAADPMGSL